MKRILLSLTFASMHLLFHPMGLAEEKPIPIYSIEILSPQPEETFQNSAQSITVQLSINPTLEPEDTVVIYVDGNEATEPQNSTSIVLPWLERGSHTIQARIIQPKGQGAETNIITIYQQRTSTLLR